MHDHGPDHQSDHPTHAAPPAAANLLPDGSPDWEAIEFDVLCSRCGYNLRTLTRPRCTECGLDFAWPDVLDAAAHRSDFLFEHNWRTRPVRSMVVTIWRSFRPRTFWEKVSIHEHVNRAALWLFVLLAIVSFSIALHGTAALMALTLQAVNTAAPILRTKLPALSQAMWSMEDEYREFAITILDADIEYLWVPTCAIIIILASFLLLRMLWQTLARYRILGEHVLRVVAYAATPGACWAAWLLLLAGTVIFIAELEPPPDTVAGVIVFMLLFFAILGMPFALYLGAGLKHYLHLPQSWIVGITAALVGVLTLLTVLAMFSATGILR